MAKTEKKQWYSRVIWSLLFVVIAVVSIWVIVSQSRGFTWQEIRPVLSRFLDGEELPEE